MSQAVKRSLRTKNRIREHKDHGWCAKNVKEMDGKFWVLMDCLCGWTGWLPVDEL